MPSLPPAIALERFTTFGDLLKYLRRRTGLTQRELSIAVGYSDTQISRLELNQRPPDLATIAALFVPALGLEHEPETAARLLELASGLQRDDAPASGLPPFKGLNCFEEADADLFFGREALVARLLDRILSASPSPRFLGIVGASGSGKSSVARAGLVPAVRWNPSTAHWQVHLLTPTAHPLLALAARLTQGAPSATVAVALADELARDPRSLPAHIGRRLSQGAGKQGRRREASAAPAGEASPLPPHLLLVVDQFEELFTLCRDEAERGAFVDNLMAAALDPDSPASVALTLRADFYARCAPYAALRDALAAQQEYIGPMSAAELRRAIEEPARRGGWELEPGLVDVLLKDIGADGAHAPEPGALPLLSHALLETWQRRRGRTLTVSGYLASGGVRAAIGETAEAVFQDELDPQQQVIARHIFLRLTELGDAEGAAETRRRATIEELISQPESAASVRAVLTRLADARLITTDEGVAEVAHEALIREWSTLRGWLEENREGLRLHRHLTLAADGWVRHGRDPGELYRGARLVQALEWAAANPADLNRLEREFLDVSQALAGQEAAEREAQRQRELEAARRLAEAQTRAARQLRRRALYLGAAFVLALAMAGTALFFGEQARRSAIAAHTAQRITYARELAGAAINNLDVDPERSILLALQAISTTRAVDGTVLPEAEEALHRSILASQVRLTLTGHADGVLTTAFSPDGQRLATIEKDGTTLVWDASSGKELLRLPGSTAPSDSIGTQRVAFSPDGRLLATGDSNLVKLWDPASGEPIATLSGHSADVWAVAFSPDGKRLASGGVDAAVRLWDAHSGALIRAFEGHTAAVESLAFSPDGAWLATGADDLSLRIWDAASGALLANLSDFAGPVTDLAFSPDGTRLAAAAGDSLKVWQLGAGAAGGAAPVKAQEILTIPNSPANVAFSPDGTQLAVVVGSLAILLDASTGRERLTLAGHTHWVTEVAFSPDGSRLATSSLDGTAKIWNIRPGQEVLTLASSGARLAYSPDGIRLATAGADGTARVWDARTGQAQLTLAGHGGGLFGVTFSPDGTRLATASIDATAKEWQAATGRELLTLTGHEIGVRDVAFSPDGRRIATAGFDQTARLWDAATGKELLRLAGHTGLVLGVAFSPDGARLATSSADSTAKLWDAATGQLLITLTGHTQGIPDIAFSPDGTRLATGGQDATAKLWDAATGAELFTLSGHSAEIQSVAFSADGKLLATGSGDNTAKVWDVATGKELHTLPGSQGGVSAVAFSPLPGRLQLAVASYDGVTRVFNLQLDSLVELAQSRVTRSLTRQECQKYLHLAQCPQP